MLRGVGKSVRQPSWAPLVGASPLHTTQPQPRTSAPPTPSSPTPTLPPPTSHLAATQVRQRRAGARGLEPRHDHLLQRRLQHRAGAALGGCLVGSVGMLFCDRVRALRLGRSFLSARCPMSCVRLMLHAHVIPRPRPHLPTLQPTCFQLRPCTQAGGLACLQPEGLKEMNAMIKFYKENAQILKVGIRGRRQGGRERGAGGGG